MHSIFNQIGLFLHTEILVRVSATKDGAVATFNKMQQISTTRGLSDGFVAAHGAY
jgi:hypothetical protein